MSLDLDQRQRAMLQEMGVRVWWPEAPASGAVAQAQVPDASATVQAPVGKATREGTAGRSPARERVPQQSPPPLLPSSPPVSVAVEDVAIMDWPSLAHTIGTCQACKLCLGRKAAVLAAADAAAAADWLVVGEPPEEQDERLATPFAGQSGQLLDNMLRAVGVSRHGAYAAGAAATRPRSELAYVTHCVKCRPAIARNPEPAELATCESYLRREVALVQPKVILALGRFAAQTLLQGTLPEVASIPLGKLRGQVYRYQQIPVIVSYPTSYLLRAPQDKARAWADLCLAMAAKAA